MTATGALRLGVILVLGALSGCAAEGDTQGPTATASVSANKCAELKAEAARMEARGVQHRADQAGRGEVKLSAKQQAEVDKYNSILNQYLGGKCHM